MFLRPASEAHAAGGRGMDRYIRKRETINVGAYVAQLKEVRDGCVVLNQLIERNDFSAAKAFVRAGGWSTLRNAVRAVAGASETETVSPSQIFRSLESLDATLTSLEADQMRAEEAEEKAKERGREVRIAKDVAADIDVAIGQVATFADLIDQLVEASPTQVNG